ncbi:MAG: LysM peptidoglycan-binding domain-containing protein [Bacillota bacterium]|nr:LysM peptidoglycan-binding domain-containing protein [Bacillota bacterium]
MSNKKLLVILSLAVIVLIGSGIVYYDKHSKKVSTDTKPTSSSNIASKTNIKTAEPNNDTSKKSDSKDNNSNSSADKAQGQKQANPADDETQDDISYISYTVKANDTVWKIAKENMPNYSLTDKDGKVGVVTYIVNKNNLKKIGNNSYSIYVGQKITIPSENVHTTVNH